MATAARAIIIENKKILVMHRNKEGSQYYTLVGGRVNEGETTEQALVREVTEETGMHVISHKLVYVEKHAAPYNEQYVYVCEVAPHGEVALLGSSEENHMNDRGVNIHRPLWVDIKSFEHLAFRTPQLQNALLKAFKKGFPKEPQKL